MRLLLDQHAKEENWGFLLADANIALNEENWTAMIWMMQQDEQSSGARFIFNCYHRYVDLLVSG